MSPLPTLCNYWKTRLSLQKYNPNSSTKLISQIFKLVLEAHEKSVTYHATAVFLFISHNMFQLVNTDGISLKTNVISSVMN